MTIQCPACGARYRIDPSRTTKATARVKCPQCAHLFEISFDAARTGASPAAVGKSSVAVPPAGGLSGEGLEPPVATGASAAVLVVDDSKFFREMVADVLKPLQLNFLMAGDGAEALRIIRHERPSLVILDLNLPDMSGYDLIRMVRSDPVLSGLRLLAMSGIYRKEADAAEVHAAGADDFLSKSFKPENLQQRVRKLLAGEV